MNLPQLLNTIDNKHNTDLKPNPNHREASSKVYKCHTSRNWTWFRTTLCTKPSFNVIKWGRLSSVESLYECTTLGKWPFILKTKDDISKIIAKVCQNFYLNKCWHCFSCDVVITFPSIPVSLLFQLISSLILSSRILALFIRHKERDPRWLIAVDILIKVC